MHQWLLLVSVLLGVSVIPHAVYAYTSRIPAAFVVIHAVAAAACWIVGELRRQWQHRVDRVVDLATEITAAHHG